MKPISPAMVKILSSREFEVAECITIIPVYGSALKFCSGDADITYNGQLFSCGGFIGPYFDRQGSTAMINQKVGTSIDTITLDVIPGTYVLPSTQGFLTACHQGYFDSAQVTIDEVYMPTYGDTRAGGIRRFRGLVGDVDFSYSYATWTINSITQVLNTQMPLNTYQPHCINVLGGPACGVTLSSYVQHLTVTSSGSNTTGVVIASITNAVARYFDQGKIVITSGPLQGFSRGIRSVTYGAPGAITLIGELPTALPAGTTFDVYPGCDHTYGNSITVTGTVNGVDNGIAMLPNQGVSTGMQVSGLGIPAGAYVTSIRSVGVFLNTNTTSAHTNATYTFQSVNGCSKFANQARYRGFDQIPQPGAAVLAIG